MKPSTNYKKHINNSNKHKQRLASKYRRRFCINSLLGGCFVLTSLFVLKLLTGGFQKHQKKIPLKNLIKQNLLKDYAPFTNLVDTTQGNVSCDISYLIQNDCDLSNPIGSCKQCSGITQCQRFAQGISYVDSEKSGIINFSDDPSKGKCLPPRDGSFSCNPYVGDAILAKHGARPFWFCRPKYPDLVTKETYFGDVSYVVACNGRGTLINPKTGVPWSKERSYDPRLATCKCVSGSVPGDKNEFGNFSGCVSDPCAPGVSITDKQQKTQGNNNSTRFNFVDNSEKKLSFQSCSCPKGMIPCPSNAFSAIEQQFYCPEAMVNNYVTCRKDPCNVVPGFYYNYDKKICASDDLEKNHYNIWFDENVTNRGVPFIRPDICGISKVIR